MRWFDKHEDGDERIVKRFIWWPTKLFDDLPHNTNIEEEWRWLEWCEVVEKYCNGRYYWNFHGLHYKMRGWYKIAWHERKGLKK